MVTVRPLFLLGTGLILAPCTVACNGDDGAASSCNAQLDSTLGHHAEGHAPRPGETRGMALLQSRDPKIVKVGIHDFEGEYEKLNHEDESAMKGGSAAENESVTVGSEGHCTPLGSDPWASGWLDCCSGLQSCLGKHGRDYYHYRCFPSCSDDRPPTASPTMPPSMPTVPPGGSSHWQTSGEMVGNGWCTAQVPAAGWNLKMSCGGSTQVKVLTYNLFWWNLFGRRDGNGNSAGKLIKNNGPFDIIGFQECDDIHRILHDAGLAESHEAMDGGRAIGIAFAKHSWELLASGKSDVAEDRRSQYYGRRGVNWVRLKHSQSSKVVFVLNHHGPLEVNTGGQCGGTATAYNMLRVIGEHAEDNDVKVLLGDLNADETSATQRAIWTRMYRNGGNWVDAFFSSCPTGEVTKLGKGGSDHDALKLVLSI